MPKFRRCEERRHPELVEGSRRDEATCLSSDRLKTDCFAQCELAMIAVVSRAEPFSGSAIFKSELAEPLRKTLGSALQKMGS
jgi:hypothetical protein